MAQRMKGGHTPIHIQRWSPADYNGDEHVKVLQARRDYATETFYRRFLDESFLAGGDLPADPEALAAVVRMPRRDVEKALAYCLDRLVFKEGDRLFQGRVRREVTKELEFRRQQADLGKRGGRPRKTHKEDGEPKASVLDTKSPPYAVRRTPAPTPITTATDSAAVAPDPSGDLFDADEGTMPGEIPPAQSVALAKAHVLAPLPWNREAAELWWAEYHGDPPGMVFAQLKPLVRKYTWERVRPALVTYLAETPVEFVNLPKAFGGAFGTWETRARGRPARAAPASAKAQARQDSANAFIRGGLIGDRASVDRGHESASRCAAGSGDDGRDADGPGAVVPRGAESPDRR